MKKLENSLQSYGTQFQYAIISLLCQDNVFAFKIKDIIKSEYFDNKYSQYICETIIGYYEKYRCKPTFEDLKTVINTELQEKVAVPYLKVLQEIKEVDLGNKSFVIENITKFCFTRFRLETIDKERDLIMSGRFDDAKQVSLLSYKHTNEQGKEIDLKRDALAILSKNTHYNMIPMCFPTFTAKTKGGPGAGDLVVVVAQSHLGKSMWLAAQANHAATQGKNVIYFSLETKGEQLTERVLAALTGIEQYKLKDHPLKVKDMLDTLPGNVKFIQFKATEAKVDLIKAKVEELKAINFFPDMIIVDGLNQLKIQKGLSFGNSNDKFEYLAEELRDMAFEYEIPLYTAFQSNRSGFANVVADEQTIGKAIEVYQVCDVMIMLTQDPKMLESQECYATLLKNRLGAKNVMVLVHYDPSQCLFKEIREVQRSQVIDENTREKLQGGFDLITQKLAKRKVSAAV